VFALLIGHYEKRYLPNDAVTDGIYAYEAARGLGFQTGDKIISVNGKTGVRFKDIASPKMLFGSIVTVERAGKEVDIVINDSAYSLIKGGKNTRLIDAINFATLIDSVIPNTPAHKAGVQKGDRMLTVNSLDVSTIGFYVENMNRLPNQEITASFLRGTDTLHYDLTLDTSGLMGVSVNLKPSYQLKEYTLGESFVYGWKDAVNAISLNIKGLGKIFSGKEKVSSISGPIGIAQAFGTEWRWERFWYLVGLLSVILAFMNILPIPGLDGGHAIFTTYELITGRKVSDKVLQYAQSFGMFIIILLIIFVFGNDIFKLFR